MADAVKITDLDVSIVGKRILNRVTLALPSGKVIGLLGPSGAGKTTLMRVLVGLQKITCGSVSILDLPAGSPSLRRKIGYMAQLADVYSDLTVKENLHYFSDLLDTNDESIAKLIDEVELRPQENQLVKTLSGGQLTRVSLAVAMLGDPEVLILDEPTVGLDPLLRIKLWNYFHGLTRRGKTVLVSSHVMDEAGRCDRLILIHNGKILADGTVKQLLKSTSSSDVEAAFIKLVEGAK